MSQNVTEGASPGVRLKDCLFSDIYVSEGSYTWKRDGKMSPVPPELMVETMDLFRSASVAAQQSTNEFSLLHNDSQYRGVRINALSGEHYVLRRINETVLGWRQLQLPDPVLNMLLHGDSADHERVKRGGLIIVMGKSDSGKSTTLNALIDEIARREAWLTLTFEDPVETRFDKIKYETGAQVLQREIASSSFEEALKEGLRANADVIKVGEVRDTGAAHVALDAALAGHLVLTTLHASWIDTGISRLCELLGDRGPELVANALRGCIYQSFEQQAGLKHRMLYMDVLPPSDEACTLIRTGRYLQLESIIKGATQRLVYNGNPMVWKRK